MQRCYTEVETGALFFFRLGRFHLVQEKIVKALVHLICGLQCIYTYIHIYIYIFCFVHVAPVCF